jgi:dienelactone hydrolase
VLFAAVAAQSAVADEQVTIGSVLAGKGPFTALLVRPPGTGPFPAIVALHGCSGLLTRRGRLRAREADWADRLAAAGYVVLLPDSFSARGVREICTARERTITPQDRAGDAAASAEWLAGQGLVDKGRLALMGWSHGAMTVLWTLRPGFLASPSPFRTAVGFYPGCREIGQLADWRPSVPLTVLMGAADDWTRPGPCRALATRTGFRFIEYAGAYHGFDAPDTPLRMRTDLPRLKAGGAHIGTDPAARAAAIEEVTAIFANALRAP